MESQKTRLKPRYQTKTQIFGKILRKTGQFLNNTFGFYSSVIAQAQLKPRRQDGHSVFKKLRSEDRDYVNVI